MKKKVQLYINIPFYDVDKMNLVWFGNYFKYFDCARTILFKKYKINILNEQNSIKKFIWPIIETSCTYHSKITYRDKIKVSAELVKNKHFIKINYTIKNKRKIVAKAYTIQAKSIRN